MIKKSTLNHSIIQTSHHPTILLGLDPGLNHTGWGIIKADQNQLAFVACGAVHTKASLALPDRLKLLHDGLFQVIQLYKPDEAAIEETFVNKSGSSTLKLGQARGAVMLTAALAGLRIAEYSANLVKKSVVGNGHAEKTQVAMMVKVLLPKSDATSADAADALAVAITHAHLRKVTSY